MSALAAGAVGFFAGFVTCTLVVLAAVAEVLARLERDAEREGSP